MKSSNKIKNSSNLVLLIIALLLATKAYPQNTDTTENNLAIKVQLRSRLEIRDGAFRPLLKSEDPAILISNRIRLSFDYSYKNILSVKITPQSVGLYGQADMVQGIESHGNELAFFEAWTELKLADYWDLKVGRQVISLDDERFFGELDWAQGGRAHDALSLHFNKNSYEVKGFFAYNQSYTPLYSGNLNNPSGTLYNNTNSMAYKWMQTIWMAIPLGQSSKISLFATNLGLQKAKTLTKSISLHQLQTFGANYYHTATIFNGSLSAYYQTGKNISGLYTEAYMFAANAGFNITSKWNLSIGSDCLSGNDVGKTNTHNESFIPYFHTGHKFYGSMDYYYSGNSHRNTGLSDNYLKLNFKSEKKYSIQMALHQFYTPNDVYDGLTKYKNNLGQEMDLSFSYKINKFSMVTGGYSFYLTSPTLTYLKNVNNSNPYQQWFWLSLNIVPQLFKTKF